MKLSLPLSLFWYYIVTPSLWNTRRKICGTAASSLDRFMWWSKHTDRGSLKLSDSARKFYHGPNLHYTPLFLDLNFLTRFIGWDHCHHRLAWSAFKTQPRPCPILSKFPSPLLPPQYPPLLDNPHINPKSHHWILGV